MAYYAALASTMELLEEMSRDHDRIHVKKQTIKTLHKRLGTLLASLDDYSSTSDESSDRLERRIRDVSYQARDIIVSETRGAKRSFIIFSYEMAMHRLSQQHQDLKKVKKEVDSILEEIIKINEIYQTEDFQLNYCPAENGDSKQADNDMVGFDEQLTTIKTQLCSESRKLQTISIVGMGGIGKTTLARNVFDDNLIVYYFHVRVWVTVSQDYNKRKVLREIKDSLKVVNEESREVGDEELPEYIYKHLKGMRYLIVMDDMWDTKALDDVRMILPDDSNGSRVLITTRLLSVADYYASNTFNSVHEMQFLDKEQSWNMLREKVFGQEHCPRELEGIGKSIAINCRGLPLAIVVIAGVLSKIGRTRCDWQKIETNVSSVVVSSDDEHCVKILSLSYNHLPHHLKPCFLYFGALPEDYEISASRLVKLWVAEGFLRPSESKSLEELAKGYLDELVKRNLVLITRKRPGGELKSCSVHDLMRDLCMKRIRYEKFFLLTCRENENVDVENVRRICINHDDFDFTRGVEDIDRQVHSILHWSCSETIPKNLISFATGFKLLRVLEVLEVKFQSFPEEIVKLFHLRYVAYQIILRGHIIDIPPSISKLENLQTLIFHPPTAAAVVRRYFVLLPSEIWNMAQLRHLIMKDMTLSQPENTAGDVTVLENLQTLETIRNFIFTQKFIKMVKKLEKLKVRYAQGEHHYGKWQKFCLNNLVHLCQLQTLEISFHPSVGLIKYIDPFPKSFALPKSLKKLSLYGCQLPWKDIAVVGSLPNLELLKLKHDSFVGHEWKSIEGGFIRLKYLLMETLNVKYWRAESSHLPALEHLEIVECFHLEEIPYEIGEIPTLELIEVKYSRLAVESAMRIQEEQRDMGNDTLQVRVFDYW